MFNSREFEYADTKVSVLASELSGLRGLTYKISQEKEFVYGQGNTPKSIQRGNKKGEGVLTVLKSDYDLMHLAAVAAGYNNLLEVPGKLINISCVYQKDDASSIATDILLTCEFTEIEDGMKQGDKMKEISLPFMFISHKKA